MKYLEIFKLFENRGDLSLDDLTGKLLHLYGSIPLTKEKSSRVINMILKSSGLDFDLGQDVNFVGTQFKTHDKVRFMDYFDSLLKGTSTRGDNFEGMIAGFYDGNLMPTGHKFDVEIEGKNWSVKFVNSPKESIQIGSYENVLKVDDDFVEDIMQWGGVSRLFQMNSKLMSEMKLSPAQKAKITKLKKEVWSYISNGVDGWLIAYPNKKEDPDYIEINMLETDIMGDIFINKGLVASPKGGYKNTFKLGMSSLYKKHPYNVQFRVNIPKLNEEQLRDMLYGREEDKKDNNRVWAKDVFGHFGPKMRPDVVKYIRSNKDRIIKKLSEFE